MLGTKSDKDIREITPILNKIKEVYPDIEKLSNDGLRQKTAEFRNKIAAAVEENCCRLSGQDTAQ